MKKHKITTRLREIIKEGIKEVVASKNIENKDTIKVLNGYLEAALWTGEFDDLDIDDIHIDTKIDAYNDVKFFLNKSKHLDLDIEPEQIGHDLWLTRNRHGAGFWDRGLGDVGEELTKISHEMGGKDVFIGDDNYIHIE